MTFMFLNAIAFNQPIGDWNVSNVNYMRGMFHGATSFTQDLRNWSIPNNPENVNMMFENCPISDANKPQNFHDVVTYGGRAKKTLRIRRANRKRPRKGTRSRKGRRTLKRGTRRRR